MSFVTQVAAGVVVGLLVSVISCVLFTGRFPAGIRTAPWWAWLILLVVASAVIVALVIRQRRRMTGGILYHNFWTRRHGEPFRIWRPEATKKPTFARVVERFRSVLRRLVKSRNRTT